MIQHEIPPADYEELRIALVMNGGVSLAVWIGGVTHEINRAMRCEDVYGELLDLTATAARVDVISGASAGGINGALLALARAYDVDLALVRDVWLQHGSLERLLHTPYDATATSLLRGNEQFFDDLRAAFKNIRGTGAITSPAVVPIDLTLTTTMLRGMPNQSTDDLEVQVGDLTHRARFVFRRGEHLKTDPFTDEHIDQRLALASRASASFPVAFEPVYCPIGTEKPPSDARLLDMKDPASFEKSRFLLDGGILDNKPLEAAIDAVFRQRASREVRRVLAYVVPSPGDPSKDDADDIEKAPTVGAVALASLIELPRVESISAELKAVAEHNRLARRKRDTRLSLVKELGPEGMEALAARLFQVYRRRRAVGASEYIVDQVAATLAQTASTPIGRRRRDWVGRLMLSLPSVPWVPDALPPAAGLDDPGAIQHWGWGAYAVEHIADIMFDIFWRTLIVVPLGAAGDPALRERLKRRYAIAYELRAALPQRRLADQVFWALRAPALAGIMTLEPVRMAREARAWASAAAVDWSRQTAELSLSEGARSYSRDPLPLGEIPATEAVAWIAWTMASLLADATTDIEQAGELGEKHGRTDQDKGMGSDVLAYRRCLMPDGERGPAAVLARLLTLEVVQYSTGAHQDVPEQVVELVQISANVPNAFTSLSTAKEKLAGAQLANFGGFYKKAWRANDWMFGRMDGADRLARILLNPARLARLYANAVERVVAALHEIAVPADAEPDLGRLLEAHWQKRESLIRRELAFLERADIPVPEQLPHAVEAVVAKVHLSVMREELPVLVSAAEDDRRRGAGATGASADLIAAAKRLVGGNGPAAWDRLTATNLVALFRSCRVAEERFAGEVGSDLFTSNLTRSLAVAASMVARPSAGLGVLGRVLHVVRVPMLVVDALAQNAVSSSRSASFLSGVIVALSGATVALLLLTDVHLPAAVAWVGSLAFVTTIALALRRYPRLVVLWLALAALVWGRFALLPAVAALGRAWRGEPLS